MDWIDTLHDEILVEMRRPTVSYETKQYANLRLVEMREELHEVTRENAYEDKLLRALDREREKFLLSQRDGEPEDILEGTPYDEVREEPVCTCEGRFGHRCPLKRGNLPREIRDVDDIDDGIRRFRAAHDGNPIVLEAAQREWAELVGEVENLLRDLLSILSSDEIPESADWSGPQHPDEQAAD